MASVIPETWSVPEKFRQRVGTSAGRQRAMIDAGHLLLILHELPKAGEVERAARLFWRAPSGEWRATGTKGNGLNALKEHLQTYRKRVSELDEAIDAANTAAQLYGVLRSLAPLTRAARSMHRALQDAREGIDNKDIIVLRDAAGDVERTSELLSGDAKNALDYIEAKEAEQQTLLARRTSEAQHRLNMIAALFLPITAVGSMLGMNLTNGLEGRSALAFWIVCAVAFAMGFLVRVSVTRSEPKASE
jgi:hypothetical protein